MKTSVVNDLVAFAGGMSAVGSFHFQSCFDLRMICMHPLYCANAEILQILLACSSADPEVVDTLIIVPYYARLLHQPSQSRICCF